MTFNAAQVAQEAEAGLAEVGVDCTITTAGGWTGTGANATKTAGAAHACKVVFSEWESHLVGGTAIQVGDRKAMIGASTLQVQPEPGFILEFQGQKYQVVAPVESIAPNGTPVLYTANLREVD